MKKEKRTPSLIHKTNVKVRFSEVDIMQIAWHGSYLKYLEDGREDFGTHYGIGYMDIYRAGYKAPIVSLHIDYKNPVAIGDSITVETRYIPCEAAKIQFDYIIYNHRGDTIAEASTTQVFLDLNNDLVLLNPAFYNQWKEKYGTSNK
jgi:acyl-CoA thioester hydrolase